MAIVCKHALVLLLITLILLACQPKGPEVTRIQARVTPPTSSIEPGEHPLELGTILFINRKCEWRDGILYVPKSYKPENPAPLMIWLHGGGGDADQAKYMFPLANRFGIVMLSLDARHNTWDGIDSPFGPDVMFIDKALHYTFEHLAIDPDKVTLAGLSDGGSYALALGRANGDLFTHLVAVAPWRLRPPSPPLGQPKILVAHGTNDKVYPYLHSRHVLVPSLKKAGYDVAYIEFDGPHWVPEEVVTQIFEWLLQTRV